MSFLCPPWSHPGLEGCLRVLDQRQWEVQGLGGEGKRPPWSAGQALLLQLCSDAAWSPGQDRGFEGVTGGGA